MPGASLAGLPEAPAGFGDEESRKLSREISGDIRWSGGDPDTGYAAHDDVYPARQTEQPGTALRTHDDVPPSVPSQRLPAEDDAAQQPARPAATGRATAASASVPASNRVAPDEQPVVPPTTPPQPRVYGRPAQPADEPPAQPEPEGADDGWSGPPEPVARATASARVAPPAPMERSAPMEPPAPVERPAPELPGRPFDPAPFDAVPFGGSSGYAPATRVNGHGLNGHVPAPHDQDHKPYSEHTSDLAGRVRPAPTPPDPFPTAPASPPDLYGATTPDLYGGVGTANGPAARATVTPPVPAETTSWAAPAEPEPPAAEEKPSPPKPVRRLPILVSVLAAAIALVSIPMTIVWLLAQGSADEGFTVDVGQCVKQSGDRAVHATCGEPETFTVVSKVDTKEQCPDPNQQFVLNPTGDGRTQVLCLKPAG